MMPGEKQRRSYVASLISAVFSLIVCISVSPANAKVLCTLISDPVDNKVLMEQGEGCFNRVTPASTTKLALAVMGFDSGFLKSPHEPMLPFREGYADWLGDVWKQPTDPTRWLKYSVVWYSQLITHHLGQQRVEQYAAKFGFGNADFSGEPGKMDGLDRAWISSSLKISPHEQVTFLEKLVNRKLPIAPDVFDKVNQSVDTWPVGDGWMIHGKTGSSMPRTAADGSIDWHGSFGWFVGWASKGDSKLVFAKLTQYEKGDKNFGGLGARDALLKEFPAFVDSLGQ